ncbi:MAG: SpoIIE family protein phosphatase [Parvicellaceae bacterium]
MFSYFLVVDFSVADISISKIHRNHPLLYIIDSAPFVLIILVSVLDYFFNKELKQNLVKTKELKTFYESILNTIPVDIAVFDENHRYKFVNPAAIKNDDLRKKIIGMDDFEYFKSLNRNENPAKERRKRFNKLKSTKQPTEWQHNIVGKDNETLTILRKMFPVFHKNKLKMVIGFGLDITDSIKKDKKIESLSRFPKENPNVIARYNFDKKLLYVNDAGVNYFNTEKFNKDDFFSKINEFLDDSIKNKKNIRRDVNFGINIFDVEIVPIHKEKYVNVYAVNVTTYRNKIKDQQQKLLDLADQLREHNLHLEQKVNERTLELTQINEEINSSVKYARRLQDAVIAQQNLPSSNFNESFVVYQPKDIVGGDFYFTYELEGNTIFGVADCTGHGIPGAMLTLMCMTFLDYAINQFKLTEPKEILDRVTNLITNSFKAKGGEVKDGMDLCLLSWKSNSKKILFSGANSKIMILSGNQKTILKGDSRPVGYWIDNDKKFTQQEIQLSKDDQIFMFSDGLPDQFGGENGKKLKYPNFYKMLEGIKDLSPKDKRIKIKQFSKDWIGNNDQIDDITIAGVKF